jgi:hypothetical protein
MLPILQSAWLASQFQESRSSPDDWDAPLQGGRTCLCPPSGHSSHRRLTVAAPSEQARGHDLSPLEGVTLITGNSYLFWTQRRRVLSQLCVSNRRVTSTLARGLLPKSLALVAWRMCRLPIAFDCLPTQGLHAGQLHHEGRLLRGGDAGMSQYSPWRVADMQSQTLDVMRSRRAKLKHQRPCCIWFTGLSGSGKSSIAKLLEQRLLHAGRHTYLLDGDNIRQGLNRDLNFTEPDRGERSPGCRGGRTHGRRGPRSPGVADFPV